MVFLSKAGQSMASTAPTQNSFKELAFNEVQHLLCWWTIISQVALKMIYTVVLVYTE